MKDNLSLTNRINTFNRITDLLKGTNSTLFNLQPKRSGSLYDGDFGLLKIYEDVNCLLGLVVYDADSKTINVSPQSWMASKKANYLIEFKNPIFMDEIIAIPAKLFDESSKLITMF